MSVKGPAKFVILIIILAVVASLILWANQSKPVKVLVQAVGYGVVQDTVTNTRVGTVKACRRAGISPAIGGQIDSLPVKEGDQVKPGQVLMNLWNEDQLAELALAQSEAKTAQANATQACIKSEVAKREAERLQQLRRKNLTSEESVDRADGESRGLKAACDAAKANHEVSRARIQVVKSHLERTRLTAPFAGTVAEVNGEVGEFVTPSPVGVPTPPAIDLIDVSCLYISAPIDEVDVPRIRVGQPVKISLDAIKDRVFEGRVRRIAPYVLEVEKQARTVDVEVDFNCPEDCRGMLPGYSADIEVILQEHEKTLRIPTEALLEGNRILRYTPDGMLKAQTVEPGLSNWAWTEIKSGIGENDKVVVSVDRDGVTDGAKAMAELQNPDD
ncbi:MAG: efflux RND transporter periplasmic adaptor subunit [Gammaproteobacteria bacterium]|nr:efflux RND transporter periplasmic adaptor subunit [Gammaproteobacteria bacterium]